MTQACDILQKVTPILLIIKLITEFVAYETLHCNTSSPNLVFIQIDLIIKQKLTPRRNHCFKNYTSLSKKQLIKAID